MEGPWRGSWSGWGREKGEGREEEPTLTQSFILWILILPDFESADKKSSVRCDTQVAKLEVR